MKKTNQQRQVQAHQVGSLLTVPEGLPQLPVKCHPNPTHLPRLQPSRGWMMMTAVAPPGPRQVGQVHLTFLYLQKVNQRS